MASIGYATLDVIPSLRGMEKNLEQGMVGPTTRVSAKSGKKSGEIFARSYLGPLKAVGATALGFLAVDKIAGFAKDSISEARESQKVTALTAQVIKSTGGAANVTAKQVSNLSTALSLKTGIDDEVIQSGQNMLLTFKNVRNEVGKGNDIFDQASSILVDLSSAMGTEPKQAAIQLGKALNDPIKGITALTRVGVTFDDQQKKTIKRLVETGHAADAQKIILKELRSEFGGAAAAQATAGDKAKVAFKNLEEQIGTALLPLLDKAERKLSKDIIPDVSRFITEMQSGKGTGGKVAQDLEDIYDAGKKVVKIGAAVVHAFDGLPSGLKKAIALGGVSAFAISKIPGAPTVAKGVVGGLTSGGVQKVFVTNPGFGKGGPGIPGQPKLPKTTPVPSSGLARFIGPTFNTAGFLAVSKLFDTIDEKINHTTLSTRGLDTELFNLGKSGQASGGLRGTYGKDLDDLDKKVKNFVGTAGKINNAGVAIGKILPGHGAMEKTKEGLDDLDTSLARLAKRHPSTGMQAIKRVLDASKLSAEDAAKVFPKATSALGRLQVKLAKANNTDVSKIQHSLLGGLSGVDKVLTKLGKKNAKPKVTLTGVPGAVSGSGKVGSALDRLDKKDAKPKAHLQDKATGGLRSLNKLLGVTGAKNATPKVSLTDHASGPLAAIQSRLTNIKNKSITVTTHYATTGRPLPDARHIATGGSVWGPGTGTSDSIPAMLSNGEEVINARQAAKHRALLKAINAGAQGFASGGTVGGGGSAGGGVAINYNGAVYAFDPEQWGRRQAARVQTAVSVAGMP